MPTTSYKNIYLITLLTLAISTGLKGQSGDVLTKLEQAQSLYSNKLYDSSLVVLKQYLRQAEVSEDWVAVAAAQSLMSKNYNRKRESKLRLSAADAALGTIMRHLPDKDSLLADALKAKGDAFIPLRSYDSSIHYLQQAEAVYLKQSNWTRIASCRVGVGSNLYRLRQFTSADTILSDTRKLIEDKLDPLPSIYGTVLNLLGAVYNNTGDYEKGLDNAIKSVRFRESQTSSGQRLIYAYNNLGIAYLNRADYDQAQEVLERAELTAQTDIASNASPLASIYNNLMLIHLRKKNYPLALGYGSKRANLVSKYKVRVTEASEIIFYNNLALIQIQSGEFNVAKSHLDRFFKLAPESRQTLSNLGFYHHQLNNPVEATKYLNLAIGVFDNDKNPEVAKLYRYLAEMAALNDDPGAIAEHFRKSISILVPGFQTDTEWSVPVLRGIRSKRELLKTLMSQARYLDGLNTQPDALNKTLTTAVALVDSMYYDHKAEGSRVFLKSEALPLYELAIKTLFSSYSQNNDKGTLSTLFDLFEKGKSSQLSDLLQIKNANMMGGVPSRFIEQERALEIDVAFYESELYKARQEEDSIKTRLYNTYRLEKTNELDQLREMFRASYPRYYQARHGLSKLSLAEVQKKLGKSDELLIEYFVGENSVFAMAISETEVAIQEISEPMASLRSLTSQYTSTISNTSLLQTNQKIAYQRLISRGHGLYQQLLAPLLNHLQKAPETLYIVPDGFLNYLPFEALITESIPSGSTPDFIGIPYLIKKYPVRYSYSASVPQNPNRRGWKKSRVLAMAPFSAENLPDTGDEIEEVDKYFSALLFQGATGTETEFQSQANSFDVLHLATHGTIDVQNPGQSYLSFAPDTTDGRLHVYELENMNLDAKLAILSACETGSGNFVAGEGVMSLARGFTYAGVSSILMSLWKVDDRSGTDLISGFYEGLSAEVNKAGALRAAKLSYLENADQLHAHPYFWSQFVLVGDPAPIKSIPTWQLWITLAALTLLGGLALVRRRAQRNT
ncbi:MAG: CHAT domain-containing protein [Roseivirga sp.]|nr:CHAT domain-containing protein [Roseivirga sp.]